MGRRDFNTVYTDVSSAAGWRATVGVSPAWSDLPAFATFPSLTEQMVSIDWMHSFHMGVARDLLGTGIKIIAGGKDYFDYRTIDLRLKALLRDVKQFAKDHGKGISVTKLTKSGLGWSGGQTPEFKGWLPCSSDSRPEIPGRDWLVWYFARTSSAPFCSLLRFSCPMQRSIRCVCWETCLSMATSGLQARP